MRVYLPAGTRPGDPVAVFHHPLYQRRWALWEWFLADLKERMPVAILAGPNHFERVAPGCFPGQGTCNANPWRFFEAIRQWSWDQQVAMDLLRAEGLRPAAAIGFSLGAFQTLLLASAGGLPDLPIVTIACCNRYAYGLQHGALGGAIVASMRAVGIDAPRLRRMAAALALERYVRVLRGRPVLHVWGMFDPVDPQPSGKRLLAALRPTRSVPIPAGHGSLLLFRRSIGKEIRAFLGGLEVGERLPAIRA
jgi:pimeloyl-ACP methyl ester carboxylesterase